MGWRSLLPAVLFLVAQPRVGAAQCNATQLCAAGTPTCIVSSPCTIPAGSTFDVRPRDLVVAQGTRLAVGPGADAVHLLAANVRLDAGARIALAGESGDPGSGGALVVEATGGITMRIGSSIEATGADFGGQVTLDAVQAVLLDGAIDASANANNGAGGTVTVTSHAGRVSVGGNGVLANGGAKGELGGFGGALAIQSATDLTVDAPIAAARGDCFFCSIDLFAQAGVLTTTARGTLDVRGSGGIGGGGTVGVTAGGAIVVNGAIMATAAGSPELGGETGGAVTISSFDGDVQLAGAVDLRGAAPDGDGGTLAVDASRDVRVVAPISVETEAQGEGGSVTLSAGRALSIESSIDARGGAFGGGAIDGESDESLDVLGTAVLLADGRDGGPGGSTELEACRVDVRAGALVSSLGGGAFAGTVVTSHGTMAVGGTLRTDGGGSNALVSRTNPPTVLPSARITPPPQVRLDAELTCCEDCPVTTTTTTSTSSTSSTSTTSSSTTTSRPSTTTSTTSTSTSSTASTTTSSSTPSSSTSTTSGTTSTTTSLPPLPCDDAPGASWDALRCRLSVLQNAVDAFPEEALGGPKTARSLAKHVARAARQMTIGAKARRPLRPLRRVAKEMRRFDALLARGERRGVIASDVADVLLAASTAVDAAVRRLGA